MKTKFISLLLVSLIYSGTLFSQIKLDDFIFKPVLIIPTNGTIASFNPSIPVPPNSPGSNYPYIGGVDYAGRIKNICSNTTVSLVAPANAVSYQWYIVLASTYRQKSGNYVWTEWAALKGYTDDTLKAVYKTLFSSTYTAHAAFYCVYTTKTLTKSGYVYTTKVTGITALSKAVAPVINQFTVDAAYFCPGNNVTIQADIDISGDQVDVFWEREYPYNSGSWTKITNPTDPFTFPGESYWDNTYDYRLAVVSTCVNYRSATFHDMPLYIEKAYPESYVSLTSYIKNTCINTQTNFTLELNNKNNFFTYTYYWEYKAADSQTWTKITSTQGGIFADYNTLSLKITPNSATLHNMQFRCTTIGACATIVSNSFTLKLTLPPVITNIISIDTACTGEIVTFSAVVEPNPQSTPVQYRWKINDNLGNGQFFSESNVNFNYTAGSQPVVITCEVQNGTECIGRTDYFSKSLKIYENPNVSINVTTTGCGGVTADLTAEVSSGKSPYTYLWDIPALANETTKTIKNKQTNQTYSVSVTDACNHTTESSTYVTSLPFLSVQGTKTDVLCNGQSNGSIQAVVAGGVAPYNIYITKNNDGIIDTIITYSDTLFGLVNVTNIPAGEYTIIVNDLCGTIKSISIKISEPQVLSSSISDYKNVTCHNGGDGYATVETNGGSAPYTINWINGQHTQTASGLFAGEYLVNVTDNNGCLASTKVDISEPQSLSVTIQESDASCFGKNDGSVKLFISGGAQPVKSSLFNEDYSMSGTSFSDLTPNTYHVIASDACGLTILDSITVSEPKQLQYTLSKSDITCFGETDGEVEVTISNGVEPKSLIWSTGNTSSINSGLSAGYYKISITDACTSFVDSINIIEPAELKVDILGEDIICSGTPTGAAYAVVSGGTFPFKYTWNNGYKSEYLPDLYAGNYTVQVVDANGCNTANSVTITQNLQLTARASVQDVACANDSTGQIAIITENSVGAVRYDWSVAEWANYDTIFNVKKGNYTVTVNDDCNIPVSLKIEVVELHKPLALTVTSKDVSCYGMMDGAAYLFPTDGYEPYSILWSNNGTTTSVEEMLDQTLWYQVSDMCQDTIKGEVVISEPDPIQLSVDVNNVSCFGDGDGTAYISAYGGIQPFIFNWNIGVHTQYTQGLFAGNYRVNVFDKNGCFEFIEFEVLQPEPLSVSFDVTNTNCGQNNGAIAAIVTGGTEPYSYKWSNNDSVASISKIPTGTYSISVVDNHSCSSSAKTIIESSLIGYDICLVTVDKETGKNKITWEKTNTSPVTDVDIYRMIGGEYQWMGNVSASKYSFFDDELSNPLVVASRYAIVSNDACGNQSERSPFHQTIHLGSAMGSDGTSIVLDWTEYVDESGQYKPRWYYLYRGTDAKNMVLFDSVDAIVSTEYNDIDPQGAKFYRVAVKKEDQCIASGLKSDSGPYSQSISNISESELSTGLTETDTIITLYPNPNDGDFFIKLDDFENTVVEISNIEGQVLWKSVLSDNITEINIPKAKNGIYYLHLTNKTLDIIKSIVISK